MGGDFDPRPEKPKMLNHTDTCSSVVVQSNYDTSCPRCAIINKVIMLRRKRTAFGSSWAEQQTAESVAQAIISKHGLAHAECIDRLYVKQEAIAKGERPVPQRRNTTRRSAMDKAQEKLYRPFGFNVLDGDEILINDL